MAKPQKLGYHLEKCKGWGVRNPPKEELEGHSALGGFDFMTKLFLVLMEEWSWKTSGKLPELQITEPLIPAVPRAPREWIPHHFGGAEMGRSSSWQGAAPSSLPLCLILCLAPGEVFLLSAASSEGFSRGFLRFCGFLFVLLCIGFVLWMKGSISLSSELPPCFWNDLECLSPVSCAEPPKSLTLLFDLLFPQSPEPPQLLPGCGTFRESPPAFPGACWVLLEVSALMWPVSPPLTCTHPSRRCSYCRNTCAMLLVFLLEIKKTNPKKPHQQQKNHLGFFPHSNSI